MRLYHSLYLSNLLALLDLAADEYGEAVVREWELRLEGKGGLSGDNNAKYIRELRNAAVHRGLDVASRGEVVGEHVVALSPPAVSNLKGTKGPYKAPDRLLRNVFAFAEEAIGPTIMRFAAPDIEIFEQMDDSRMRERYLADVAADPDIPEWAKSIGQKHLADVPFAAVRAAQAARLRRAFASPDAV